VQDAPHLFARAAYLCAFMPASGVPAADYLFLPENEGDLAAAGLTAGASELTADGWGSVPRAYIICTRDQALRPPLQRKFIADADAAFPGNLTEVYTLDSSHSPFLSMPGDLADIVLKL
jgi:hypothetical protein